MVLIVDNLFRASLQRDRLGYLRKMIDGGDRDENSLTMFRTKDPTTGVRSFKRQRRADWAIAEFFRTTKIWSKDHRNSQWQDVDQVIPLVEKCIKAGSEKVKDSDSGSYLIRRWYKLIHFSSKAQCSALLAPSKFTVAPSRNLVH